MEREDLIKILEGDISHIDSVNIKDVGKFTVRVVVEPHHVKKMLLNYLNGKINANDLTKWASFICMRGGEYVDAYPRYPDDKMEDFYEDMFYVIQRLSTPQIDGEVNEERVKAYLSELEEKYFK